MTISEMRLILTDILATTQADDPPAFALTRIALQVRNALTYMDMQARGVRGVATGHITPALYEFRCGGFSLAALPGEDMAAVIAAAEATLDEVERRPGLGVEL